MKWNDYFYSNDVLKNKLNIKDAKQLEVTENALVVEKTKTVPKVLLNYEGLKTIHKHLFEDVYDWAGTERQVGMRKEGKPFIAPHAIEAEANKVFNRLEQQQYLTGLSQDEFAIKAAHTFGDINALHPFRDGNGRTQRIFLEQVAEQAGHELSFNSITQERMIQASIEFSAGAPEKMERLFSEAVSPEKQAIVNEFNDFFKSEKGLKQWNSLYIAASTEGQTYEGTFFGAASKGFTMQLDDDSIVVGDKKHLEQKPSVGSRITVNMPKSIEQLKTNVKDRQKEDPAEKAIKLEKAVLQNSQNLTPEQKKVITKSLSEKTQKITAQEKVNKASKSQESER